MKIASRAVQTLFFSVLAFVVLVGAVYPAVRGWVPLTVLTGSMTPTHAPGDLLMVEPLEGEERKTPQVGEVVSFYPRPDDLTGLTSHRVIDRIEDADGAVRYITQGDANAEPDAPIEAKQIAAVMKYSVPKLGFLAHALPSEAKPTIVYAGAGVLVIMAGYYAISAFRPEKKDQQEGERLEA